MVDRQKLEMILFKRFPGATPQQVASATNAIMGLDDDWEEVALPFGSQRPLDVFVEFRILRRRAE